MKRLTRPAPFCAALSLTLAAACGGAPDGQTLPNASPAETPEPAIVTAGGFDRAVQLDPETQAAWRGVTILVTDRETGDREQFEVPLAGAELLGSSGLVLTAETFVPDFVMDEHGIRSRSADPVNPAARVRISEDGAADFEGWLFAAMPETLPFQHERYEVLLVEGIAADPR
jgi:hypothetical protein